MNNYFKSGVDYFLLYVLNYKLYIQIILYTFCWWGHVPSVPSVPSWELGKQNALLLKCSRWDMKPAGTQGIRELQLNIQIALKSNLVQGSVSKLEWNAAFHMHPILRQGWWFNAWLWTHTTGRGCHDQSVPCHYWWINAWDLIYYVCKRQIIFTSRNCSFC